MKTFLSLLILFSHLALADTPPPGTVKAKTWSGDGNTSIGATSSSLNTYLTNSSLPVTIASPVPVTGTFWQSTQPVSIASPVPVTGTFWQTTQPISGTVISNIGTTNGLALDTSVNGLLLGQSSTTSGQTGPLIQGSVTTTSPSYTNGKTSPFSLTVAGGLRIDGSAVVQPVSGTFFQATQPVSIASPVPVTGTFWQTTQPVSGAVTANAGTGTFTVDASGHTVPVSGTFWQATQPVSGTVTANVGTTNGLALDTSVNGLLVAQASTTSGQSGPLIQGSVTTLAPSYTTAKTSPLSLTTVGNLRVDGSSVTQPVSGTFWQATQPVSGTFFQATQPVSLASLPALAAGSAIVGKVGIDQTTPGTTNGVQVNAALPAGTNVIGHVIVDTAPTTAVSQSGTWTVNSKAATPSALTVKQAAISIGSSAVRLTNDGSAPASTRVLLVAQLLSTSTANCYFGSSGVTTTSTTRGVQMFAGQTISFTNDAGDYYAICDTSSQTVFVTEQE